MLSIVRDRHPPATVRPPAGVPPRGAGKWTIQCRAPTTAWSDRADGDAVALPRTYGMAIPLVSVVHRIAEWAFSPKGRSSANTLGQAGSWKC